MKWISLHLNMLPIVAIQIDQKIQHFENLSQKVMTQGQVSDIQQLNQLRTAMKRRMHQLDVFYERHHQDQTIPLFHMLRIKLQRAIFKKQHISNETMEISLSKDKDSLLVQPIAKYNFGEHLSFSDYQPLFANQKKNQQSPTKQVKYENLTPHKQFPLKTKEKKPQQKKIQQKEKEKEKVKKQPTPIHTKSSANVKEIQPSVGYSAHNKQKIGMKNSYSSQSTVMNKKRSQILNQSKEKQKQKLKQKEKQKQKPRRTSITQLTKSKQKQTQEGKSIKFPKKLVTQPQNIIIKEEQEEQNTEFRFTIKMTKEEYHNLLMMKQEMLSKK